MTKILMLSVRPDEQAAIKAWQDRHPGVEVTTAAWELRASTLIKQPALTVSLSNNATISRLKSTLN